MQLEQNEVREILARAQEIQSTRHESQMNQAEIETFLQAAEESGMQREAVLQALRERFIVPGVDSLSAGELVLAKGADNHWYIAKVRSHVGQSTEVEFYNGSVAKMPTSDISPLDLKPGMKASAYLTSYAMWCGVKVLSVNLNAGTVRISCWGSEETIPFENLRIHVRSRHSNQNWWETWQGFTIALMATGWGLTILGLILVLTRR